MDTQSFRADVNQGRVKGFEGEEWDRAHAIVNLAVEMERDQKRRFSWMIKAIARSDAPRSDLRLTRPAARLRQPDTGTPRDPFHEAEDNMYI